MLIVILETDINNLYSVCQIGTRTKRHLISLERVRPPTSPLNVSQTRTLIAFLQLMFSIPDLLSFSYGASKKESSFSWCRGSFLSFSESLGA